MPPFAKAHFPNHPGLNFQDKPEILISLLQEKILQFSVFMTAAVRPERTRGYAGFFRKILLKYYISKKLSKKPAAFKFFLERFC